jgi:undecaprenyl-diphosphatase
MSLPITAGALVYKYVDVSAEGGIDSDLRGAFVAGIISSAVTGYIAVWGTLKLVRSRSFLPFVIYRILLGVTVLVVLATPWRSNGTAGVLLPPILGWF